MLSEFESMWAGRLGRVTAAKHRIELKPGSRPVHQPSYPAGHHARGAIQRDVDKMISAGVLEPSASEWASPAVLVPMKKWIPAVLCGLPQT